MIGSDSATLSMINALRPALSYPLQHVWQEDSGFRLAAIRNKAIVAARGDYIVFIDQDCVVRPDFIKNHRRFAERGYFASFSRILVFEALTQKVISGEVVLPKVH